MYAVEFTTKLKDDGSIDVPVDNYEILKNMPIKVIILSEYPARSKDSKVLPIFDDISVNTNDFKFDRDKANAR